MVEDQFQATVSLWACGDRLENLHRLKTEESILAKPYTLVRRKRPIRHR